MPRACTQIDSAATKPAEATRTPPFPFFSHDTLAFHLDEPPSANRWWRMWRGRMVLSDEARAYKQYVANAALGKRYRPIPKPAPVRLHVVWNRGRKSGDLDKRLGVLLDALQGIAYDSDAQIVEIHAERVDSKHLHNVIVHVAARRAPAAPEGNE